MTVVPGFPRSGYPFRIGRGAVLLKIPRHADRYAFSRMAAGVAETLERYAAERRHGALALAEALSDERIATAAGLPLAEIAGELERTEHGSRAPEVVEELVVAGVAVRDGERLRCTDGTVARAALDRIAAARVVPWSSGAVAAGDLLGAFARHCRHDLDDVSVYGERTAGDGTVALELGWRRERCRIELRHGLVCCARLADPPTLIVCDTERVTDAFVRAFALDPATRAGVALLDLEALEKASAVRASVFVYLEWFLRDVYGVKLAASTPFTRTLVEAGVISLGFG
jgi:hypothetical protein